MRLHRIAVLGLLLATTGLLSAGEAILSVVPGGYAAVVPSGGAGFAFRCTNDITITALGYHLDQITGLADPIVELLDANSNVLASAHISSTNAQIGEFWFQPIAGALLPANSTNYIVGYDAGQYASTTNKVWTGIAVVKDTPATAWFDVTPELNYLGSAQGVTITGPTNVLYYGVNFLFGPPRPPLYIELASPASVQLFWPTQAVGFSLQSTPDPGSWPLTNVPGKPTVVGTNNVVTLPATDVGKFFRLRY